MVDYLEKKYIMLLASQLHKFKQKSDDVYNYRCNYCGDSEKNKSKARAYIFLSKNAYLVKCHNCGKSTNLYQLLKDLDRSLYHQYIMEKFSNAKVSVSHSNNKEPDPVKVETKSIDDFLESIEVLPNNHWVMQYIIHRKIPKQYWNILYYTGDFKSFVDKIHPEHGKKLTENDPRLIIPFYDETNELLGFQGRTLNGDKLKYITIKINPVGIKLYGLERVKKNQLVSVFEGPIDSLFLDNAVATCDSALSGASKYLSKANLILVWDAEYHNNDVKRSITQAIDDGYTVVIFPKDFPYKDINEMVMKTNYSKSYIQKYLNDHTYYGLKAKLELMNR